MYRDDWIVHQQDYCSSSVRTSPSSLLNPCPLVQGGYDHLTSRNLLIIHKSFLLPMLKLMGFKQNVEMLEPDPVQDNEFLCVQRRLDQGGGDSPPRFEGSENSSMSNMLIQPSLSFPQGSALIGSLNWASVGLFNSVGQTNWFSSPRTRLSFSHCYSSGRTSPSSLLESLSAHSR